MAKLSVAIIALCFIAFQKSSAKPTELLIGPDPASSVALSDSTHENGPLARDQRSPQYGFGDYDYSTGGSPRHFKNKRKHKPTYVPVVIQGGHGCRGHGHGCGGSNYNKPSHGGSGSFASASAGSFGSGNHGGSLSQAQSASLSFGPFSISTAQAQSSSSGGRYGGYGGYGGFNDYGFDY